MTNHLLVFGPGYTATPIMEKATERGWHVTVSYRDEAKKEKFEKAGYHTVEANKGTLQAETPVTHILTSIAPKTDIDPILENWQSWIAAQKSLHSLHYLSSTNVYGDHDGAWVDETSETKPSLDRGKRRLIAEQSWQALAAELSIPAFIYRLAGIYGPGRNALATLQAGRARRIIKAGQVFGRIHRDDIAATVWSAMIGAHEGGIFNLADDMPTPPQQVIEEAADMLGMEPPAEEPWETADMSPMARSFYLETKRVRNDKVKQELGITLRYPTFRDGLKELIKDIKQGA